ncbi:MAG: MmcB family DNA repair protein, partial [Peptostreptococcaceae bacterium]
KQKLSIKRKELTKLKKKLDKVLNSDLNDFETVLEAKNELAKKDILKHNELSIKGMKWLKDQGYISDTEYSYDKYRFDVIGVNNKDNEVIILESKVSMSDYKQDKKVDSYIKYCNKLYIITDNFDVVRSVLKNHNIMGCIYVRDEEIEIYRESECREIADVDVNEITYSIYNKLWSKIYKI